VGKTMRPWLYERVWCPPEHGQLGTCWTMNVPHCKAECSWKASWRPSGQEDSTGGHPSLVREVKA